MNEEIDYNAITSYGDDETPSGIGSVKVYDGSNYYVTIRLSDIPNAEITEVEDGDTGEPRKGIFIPFRCSGLTVTPKKNVLVTCRMEMAQIPSKHHTHLLTQIVDRTVIEERRRLGFKHCFVGFARPMFNRKDFNKKHK